MRVNEIFYSLQGEGCFTGTPAVLVRLSGCNLKCGFCDTNHASAIEMTEEDIVKCVSGYPATHVVVTGGEPTLQLTESLVDKLHEARKYVQIETNGTQRLPDGLLKTLDWITVSPKFGVRPLIQRIDELKVVFDMNHPEYIESLDSVTARVYYLQPCNLAGNTAYNIENLQSCISYIMAHPKWKLSLQTHKILNMR